MATNQTASQNTTNQGGHNQSDGIVGFRDLNSSIGGLDLSGIGAATSSATSGAVTIGDRIIGGTKSRRQYSLVKVLLFIAGSAVLIKLYKKKGK